MDNITKITLLVGLKINNFVVDLFKKSLLAMIQSVKHLSSLFMTRDISEGSLFPFHISSQYHPQYDK